MRSLRHRQRADSPYKIESREGMQARVDEHVAAMGCPRDSPLYDDSCPCGSRVLVMCSACRTAVLMLVSKRPCRHEIVYYLDDGTTLRPFEGY